MIVKLCIVCIGLCLTVYAAPSSILERTLPGLRHPLTQPADVSELQAELLSMQREDQRVRHIALTEGNLDLIREVDQKHSLRLKEIIAEFGWPRITLVGLQGSQAMWLLVQHQEGDFQKECLPFLKDAVEKQEAFFLHYAYLLDRVCMYENEPQVYGTQWVSIEDEMTMYPVRDPEFLAERRVEAGMSSIEEYSKQIRSIYGAAKRS